MSLQTDPELAQVLLGNDLNKLQDVLKERHRQKSVLRRQQDEELVSSFYASLLELAVESFAALVHLSVEWVETE